MTEPTVGPAHRKPGRVRVFWISVLTAFVLFNAVMFLWVHAERSAPVEPTVAGIFAGMLSGADQVVYWLVGVILFTIFSVLSLIAIGLHRYLRRDQQT